MTLRFILTDIRHVRWHLVAHRTCVPHKHKASVVQLPVYPLAQFKKDTTT